MVTLNCAGMLLLQSLPCALPVALQKVPALLCLHYTLAVYPGEMRCAIKVHAVRRNAMPNMQRYKRHGIWCWCTAVPQEACARTIAINNRVHTHHVLSIIIVFVAQHIIAIQVVPRVQTSTVHICGKERRRQQSTVFTLNLGGMG